MVSGGEKAVRGETQTEREKGRIEDFMGGREERGAETIRQEKVKKKEFRNDE